MVIGQIDILAMLRRDGATFTLSDVTVLPWSQFAELLRQFTWESVPNTISPGLVANYNNCNFLFDLYDFGNYKMSLYYANGGPTVFIVFGNAGERVFAREWGTND